jgi:adenine-specific DNA-methyltransferase
MMSRKKNKSFKTVETLTHDEASRKNIPTAEYQSVMYKEEQSAIRVACGRSTWYDFGIKRPQTNHHGF